MSPPERGIARATLLGFAAEALVFPVGLITAAYLTRTLGVIGYGRLTLVYAALSPVMWVASTTFAGRAAVKLIADEDDWRATAAVLLRANILTGVGAAVLFVAAVPLMASILGQPALTPYLQLAAVEIGLMPVARLHRDALTARGRYTAPAVGVSAYQLARLGLVLALVAAGWSITGVIVANLAARLVELVVYRTQQRVPIRGRRSGGLGPIGAFLGSLFVYALCLQIFNRVDLLMIGWLGADEAVGHYGAAQNLAQAPGLFAFVFAPLLIAAIRRADLAGLTERAEMLRRGSARVAIGLWAFAAPVAAGASGLTSLLFGDPFAASGSMLVWLGVAGGASLVLSVLSAHQVAAGRYNRPLLAVVPMLATAVPLQMMLIPDHGGLGAAVATAAAAVLAAAIALTFDGREKLPGRVLDLLRATLGAIAGFGGTRLAMLAHVPSPLDIVTGCVMTGTVLLAVRLVGTRQLGRVAADLVGRPRSM